jgi:hypothetical protein
LPRATASARLGGRTTWRVSGSPEFSERRIRRASRGAEDREEDEVDRERDEEDGAEAEAVAEADEAGDAVEEDEGLAGVAAWAGLRKWRPTAMEWGQSVPHSRDSRQVQRFSASFSRRMTRPAR